MDSLYAILLTAHSWIRWIALSTLVFAIFRGIRGWVQKTEFTKTDGTARTLASIALRVQFTVGLVLYFVSPVTKYFMGNFKESMTIPEVAFFGMMHVAMMIVAIGLVSVGEARSKKATASRQKFVRMTVFYLIGLIIILAAIPWPSTTIAPRPLFRGF